MSSIGDFLGWLFGQRGESSPIPPDPFALPSAEGNAGATPPPPPQTTTTKSSILEKILSFAPHQIKIEETPPPQQAQQFQLQQGTLHPMEVTTPGFPRSAPLQQQPLNTSLPPPPGPVDLDTATRGLLALPGSEKEKIQRLLQEAESSVQTGPDFQPSLNIPGKGRIALKVPRRVKG